MSDFNGQAAVVQHASLDFCFGVAGKVLEAEEKLTRLNLDAAKTTFADWHQRMQDGLTKTNGDSASGLQAALALPSTERVLTYQRQLVEIASTMQTQLGEVIDAQYQEANRQFQRFVESAGQNAPVSSEAAIAFLKQVITFANTAHDSVRKAAKQTVDFAQSTVSAATETALEPAQPVEPAIPAVESAAKAVKH
ncbi:phasin family protein [Paraburkholderia elongata]|uniref:TIGR01841 family phasin n=1 Tax=Paraburkholderia elongata TaxID=2675747 RepID=A0A972NW46_9BURK|nr:phasin family protein [Paraburkholderia elongata]NPT58892.1 TIGR01841 family phasin [Paraburkholderia elongata]